MKTAKLFGLAALVCGFAMTFSSCSNDDGDSTKTYVISFEKQDVNKDGFWCGSTTGTSKTFDDGYGGTTTQYTCTYSETPLTLTTNYSISSYGNDFWSGFAVSSRMETTFDAKTLTPDQYNNIVGKAHSGNKFLVVQRPYNGESLVINEAKGAIVKGLWYVNSAYTTNSIVNGDSYSGGPFVADDWLKCTITGKKVDGTTATVDIDLAKGTSYVKEWTRVDLSSLGKVVELSFSFTCSRTGDFGLNTPAYFCIDDVELVIEK